MPAGSPVKLKLPSVAAVVVLLRPSLPGEVKVTSAPDTAFPCASETTPATCAVPAG